MPETTLALGGVQGEDAWRRRGFCRLLRAPRFFGRALLSSELQLLAGSKRGRIESEETPKADSDSLMGMEGRWSVVVGQ